MRALFLIESHYSKIIQQEKLGVKIKFFIHTKKSLK